MNAKARPARLECREDDGSVTVYDLRFGDVETIPVPRETSPGHGNESWELDQTRYEPRRVVGAGGFGRVLEARDSRLGRIVAVKVGKDTRAQNELVREGLLTARLQHPNIIPVYDVDHAQDGAAFYTMKLLVGQSLKELLATLRVGDLEAIERYPRSRLLADFRSICLAVDYAHEQGVVHRDIKPANIILGRFGEVVLADWGLAGEIEELQQQDPTVVRGTPAYMAPERFGDEPWGSVAADVYALGASLYEILTFWPPRRGTVTEILEQLGTGPPSLPSAFAQVPRELEDVCMAALARDPSARPPSAGTLAAVIEEHLDREREDRARRERAARSVATALSALSTYQQADAQTASAQTALDQRERALTPESAEAAREAVWDERRRVEYAQVHVASLFGRATQAFESVVLDQPDHVEAHARLAELYFGRFRAAERSADRVNAAYFENLVRRHDDGTWVAEIERPAVLVAQCMDPSPQWALSRFEERGPLLQPVVVDRRSDANPVEFAVRPGSHLLVASRPGYATSRIPFVAQRGDAVRIRFTMYHEQDVPEGFVVVHSCEGDFAIGRFPVTVAEYLEFINALSELGEDVDPWLPRQIEDGPAYFKWDGSQWSLPERDPEGDSWDPQWPMILVNAHHAERYASWRSAHVSFCLPTREQWEHAARGADERRFPWGNGYDVSCAALRERNLSSPTLTPVGQMQRDRSPFGVQDLGGGVLEWTSSVGKGGTRILKGASFRSWRDDAEISKTRFARPNERYPQFGFRLCVSLGGETEIHK